MTYAIQADGLVKRFGKTTALAGVELAARPGTVLGVLGPNGAGKTTMIRILATLLRPDDGRATVGGFDVVTQAESVRRLVGLTGQYASVDDDLTGSENLIMIGQLLDLRSSEAKARANELITQFELTDAANRRVATYSGGMRRRLDLAASLVGHPEVVFLDEPTTGLDPVRREDAWRLIRSLARSGVTILLTTQYLDEAEALADEVTVIDHGKVVAHDTPDALKQVVGHQTIAVRPRDPEQLGEAAAILTAVTRRPATSPGPGLLAAPVEGEAPFTEVVRRLQKAGIGVTELSLHLPSLDEVFFSLTGHTPGEDEELVGSGGSTPEPSTSNLQEAS
jgi:oleandomycin transport system ATP-binding protein